MFNGKIRNVKHFVFFHFIRRDHSLYRLIAKNSNLRNCKCCERTMSALIHIYTNLHDKYSVTSSMCIIKGVVYLNK